ncbi:hypothetical protein ACFVR2_11500 [Gottfriedia sp. NPDC057991]|uniref:DUF7878 domain-containing protein n=1 Tax=Gottfriedia sp. NPDC057991 TaxID=3346298 RepID=UPI0036DD59A4
MEIKFSFILNTEIPIGLAYTAYKEGYIEGVLKIYLNGNVFFDEPYINLAEFGIQLGKWIQKIQSGLRENMDYETIDHNEAIINFKYTADEYWFIYSIWQIFESDEYIETNSLVKAVKDFIKELNKELLEINYIVTLDKFID